MPETTRLGAIRQRYQEARPLAKIAAVLAAISAVGALAWGLFVHPQLLLSWLLGGFIASLCASATIIYFVDKAVWAKDVGLLRGELQGLKERVDKNATEYEALLNRLPPALGGPFTSSLFQFYPHTSESIAKILSEQTCQLYRRHCRRVVVLDAADTYRLSGVEEVTIEGRKYPVWRMHFHCTWTWYNDSQVTQTPLHDFELLVMAPEVAWDAFQRGVGSIESKTETQRLETFLQTRNLLRTTLEHPGGSDLCLPADAIDQMWKLDGFRFKQGGNARVGPLKMEEVPKEELPLSVYRAYRLPADARETPLERSQELVAEYYGELALPVTGTPGSQCGTIYFPPSDVIAQEYVLSMVYPKDSITVNPSVSGCFLIDKRTHEVVTCHKPTTALPSGFHPKNGDEVAQISVNKTPLTDLHRIYLTWSANGADHSE